MNKKVNLMIGSGILSAYLSANLIKKRKDNCNDKVFKKKMYKSL